jgi:hypothetical protein
MMKYNKKGKREERGPSTLEKVHTVDTVNATLNVQILHTVLHTVVGTVEALRIISVLC